MIMQYITRGLVALALTLGLVAAPAVSIPLVQSEPVAVASANTDCNWNTSAGCIKNNVYSSRDLLVCEDFSGTSADPGCWVYSRTTFVNQGAWSPYYDTDAFYIPSDCNAYLAGPNGGKWYYTTGWVKVQNGSNHNVKLVC